MIYFGRACVLFNLTLKKPTRIEDEQMCRKILTTIKTFLSRGTQRAEKG